MTGDRLRAYGAFWRRHGFNGFVYSMAHGWGPKPLENLVSFQGTNGDGTLVYPGEIIGQVGPLPSIRLLLLRDAIEDYELNRTDAAPVFPRDREPLPDFTLAPGAPVVFDGNLTEWPVAGFVPFARDGEVEAEDVPATKMWARRDDQFLFTWRFAFKLRNRAIGWRRSSRRLMSPKRRKNGVSWRRSRAVRSPKSGRATDGSRPHCPTYRATVKSFRRLRQRRNANSARRTASAVSPGRAATHVSERPNPHRDARLPRRGRPVSDAARSVENRGQQTVTNTETVMQLGSLTGNTRRCRRAMLSFLRTVS